MNIRSIAVSTLTSEIGSSYNSDLTGAHDYEVSPGKTINLKPDSAAKSNACQGLAPEWIGSHRSCGPS